MDKFDLGHIEQNFRSSLAELTRQDITTRIWQKDHSVWHAKSDEIIERMGWLESPRQMRSQIATLDNFVEAVRKSQYTHALLMGMGGSSLAPEVFQFTFGTKKGFLELSVLDSTDPEAVLASANLDPAKTLFIVSTKSGTTIETLSAFKYFYNLTVAKVGVEQAGRHFIAITDPGSPLTHTARELNFRKIFENDPTIGGRFSVLSYFGLVPAALIGIDIEKLLQRAEDMAEKCRNTDAEVNPGVSFGAALAQATLAGRDKLTLLSSNSINHFGAWAEQLVAESSGKDGHGILPVDDEPLGSPEVYGSDRIFVWSKLAQDTRLKEQTEQLKLAGHPVVELQLKDQYDLGAEFFRWEFATAVASAILEVNPFNQPDVESAKVQAKRMVQEFKEAGKLPSPRPTLVSDTVDIYGNVDVEDVDEALDIFLADANTGPGKSSKRSYVAIQAYLPPTPAIIDALQQLRQAIRDKMRLATTVGFGPRFLHSTGQLHKGDAGNGLFIQFTATALKDVPIPDSPGSDAASISFDILKNAQALGDRKALLDKGRKLIRFHLKGEVVAGIKNVTDSL